MGLNGLNQGHAESLHGDTGGGREDWKVCARIELGDPDKVTQQKFVSAASAFQGACLLAGRCMHKMQTTMARHVR